MFTVAQTQKVATHKQNVSLCADSIVTALTTATVHNEYLHLDTCAHIIVSSVLLETKDFGLLLTTEAQTITHKRLKQN